MPAATAAAAPPEEPPAEASRFQGLRVMPSRMVSVKPAKASSGTALRPTMRSPAALARFV
jgi:hypothetical protein